jgi:peptide deformylase
MMLEILTYPNEILKQKSKDVDIFDEKLHLLLENMNETMLANNGVGLAAIQVGIPQNILIINLPDEDGNQQEDNLIEAINPQITKKDGQILFNEGCLSVPNFNEEIKRAEHIEVEYQDRYGKPQKMEASGFLAVAWQHEIEHLRGHLFIENLSIIKRKKFDKWWKKTHRK